jgi:hypothetical protein
MPTIKIHISGWYEYRIDNREALIDSAKLTPTEVDPDNAAGFHDMPPQVWEDLGLALITTVTMLQTQNPLPPPPGATMGDSNISWSAGKLEG